MIDLTAYHQSIERELLALNLPQNPANLYDPIRYFLTIGGKRMRPILALMSCELFGGTKEDANKVGVAIELFHNFSLIHDDIMDEAPLRRGQDTVHKKWNSNIAILSGDVLLVKAYKILTGYNADTALTLLKSFNKTAIEVCEGQQWDMDFETRENVSIEEYIKMIKYKTAVLLGCSLEMGAIVAGASDKDKAALYNFGVNLGLAFQLQDDLLDVYADQSKFGKQVGGDILANKKTFLMLTALYEANNNQKIKLLRLQNETNDSIKINSIKQLYNELTIKDKTELKIKHYYDKALVNFDQISASKVKKTAAFYSK